MSLVAIDVGQTGARAVRLGPNGRSTWRTRGFAAWLTGRPAVDRVADGICRIVERTGGGEDLDSVLVGLSGFDPDGSHAQVLAQQVGERTLASSVIVGSDAAAWYLGTFDQGPGIVASVGTGTVVLAADGKGKVHRVDGWGYLLGDDGSAFAIGRAGLASALRHVDGRDGSSRMSSRVMARYGSAAGLAADVYGARFPSSMIADFATLVSECAREGDAQALRIIEEAGAALGGSLVAAFRGVFALGQSIPIRMTGAMTAAGETYLAATRKAVGRGLGQETVDLDIVDADPLLGVQRLQPRVRSFLPGLVVEWHRP